MSLERRLIAYVSLVLLVSLLGGAGLTYWHVAAKVRTEMAAALAVGSRIAGNAADDGDMHGDPVRRLGRMIGNFNGDRHLRATLRDASGRVIAASSVLRPEDAAPDWFFSVVAGSPKAAAVALPPELRAAGTLRLETDAHNEVAEAWADLKLALGMMGVFFCLVLAMIVWTLRGVLRPLQELCVALTRIGCGDYAARLHWPDHPDLWSVQNGFNGMATRLADVEMQNHVLQARVHHVQEEERAELARDLHDEVAPFLFAVSADASLIRQHAHAQDTGQVDARAEDILISVGHMQTHLRSVLARLMPDMLLDLGLPGAIDALVHFWKIRAPGLSFVAEVTETPLEDRISAVVFRVVQESLSNVVRHARATAIRLSVTHGPDGIEVLVVDDGRGLPAGPCPAGLGMLGMRERVRAVGGQFEAGNRAGVRGVMVRAMLPVPAHMLAET